MSSLTLEMARIGYSASTGPSRITSAPTWTPPSTSFRRAPASINSTSPVVVLDCRFATGRGLTAKDFARAQPAVQAGDIVLICSAEPPGTASDSLRHQPYVTPEGATWLVEQGIKAVGVEPFSFEHLYEGIFVKQYSKKEAPGPISPAHAICLRDNVSIIEGLTNLERIVGRRVRFSALPLPVPGSSGSPVRAVAWDA